MITIKNISVGPRGANTLDGPIMLAPGETRDLDMTDAEVASSDRTGWFHITRAVEKQDSPPPADIDLTKLTDDELRTYLKDRGVTVDGRLGREKLLAEAEKAKAA